MKILQKRPQSAWPLTWLTSNPCSTKRMRFNNASRQTVIVNRRVNQPKIRHHGRIFLHHCRLYNRWRHFHAHFAPLPSQAQQTRLHRKSHRLHRTPVRRRPGQKQRTPRTRHGPRKAHPFSLLQGRLPHPPETETGTLLNEKGCPLEQPFVLIGIYRTPLPCISNIAQRSH